MLLVISHMLVLLVCWYYILEQRIDKITPVLHVVVVVERKLFLASAVNLNHTLYFVSKHGIIIFLMMMLEKLIK